MKSVVLIAFLLFSVAFLPHSSKILIGATEFQSAGEISIGFGNVDTLIKVESSQSQDISRSNFVGASDGNEFDTDSLQSELPITLLMTSTDTIDLETTYYFTKSRETVLKFYEWNIKDAFKPDPSSWILSNAKDDLGRQEVKNHFKRKFLMLETFINSKMGMPSQRSLESEKKIETEETLRDDVYWKNTEVSVHLYRFSDLQGHFNQIRAAVYETKTTANSSFVKARLSNINSTN